MTEPSAPRTRYVHAVIRRNGKFLMLYSEAYGYYKFPHDAAGDDETAEQALCRIVSAQTGMNLLPACIGQRRTAICTDDDGSVHEHIYCCCKPEGEPAGGQSSKGGRFTLRTVSPGTALDQNAPEGHGILTDDRRFQAMLERERVMLLSFRGSSALKCSVIALAASLLFPLLPGLYYLITGFDSPTDGGTVTGTDAFEIGVIFGCFPAVPAVLVSTVCLLLSLRDRRRKNMPRKS